MALPADILKSGFQERFGGGPSPKVYRAPGRVNLIGEHTDYNLGFVLPIALDLACYAAAAPSGDGMLTVYSKNFEERREWPVDQIPDLKPSGDWSDYALGVAVELGRAGYPLSPTNVLIYSTVPVGSGLSSSAALEVAVALALLDGRPIRPLDLARLCRRAENQFVGMPCGIMDQYVSVFARAGAALKIDCRSLESEAVALPSSMAIVVVNSMVKHELGQSAYEQRVRECSEAVRAIQQRAPAVESLRDVTPELLASGASLLPPAALRRARHVVAENERVEAFVAAARRGDLEEMGRLFVASHRSLQHDYEVSCEELDFLVDTALKLHGVYGARMTGGGFGGCTVNLLAPGALSGFESALMREYEKRFGLKPQIYRCQPAGGAAQIG